MPRHRAEPPAGIHDPNLTPLIDVSLVLVVILLVATPLALQSGIAVSHASTEGRRGAAALGAKIEISVLDDTHATVNGRAVDRAALDAALRPLVAASPTREALVRCAGGVTHGAFVGVLDTAKRAGIERIAVAGEER